MLDLKKRSVAAVATLGLLVPATAMAATVTGGPGAERLRGTKGPDQIDGMGGNDRIFGLAGDDKLTGGPGRDRIFGGRGDDTIDGGAGNDRIFAERGVDTVNGGDGNDNLWARARGDVHPGPNGEVDTVGDTLNGGAGNDTFHTRDGEVDKITCGEGNDTALLDTVDVITDATPENPNGSCEKVVRKAPKAKGSGDKAEQAAEAGATS